MYNFCVVLSVYVCVCLSVYVSFDIILILFVYFFFRIFLFTEQRLQCLTTSETEPADSPSRDDSVYILLVFPGVVFIVSLTLIILFFWRHDYFLFLRINLLKIFLRYCMYIEKPDDSYSDESGSLSSYISDIPISISISEISDRDNSVTSDPESQSSWDSRFHEEAEYIARIILIQGEESDSNPSQSSLPSCSSSYLPILRPVSNEFHPLSVEEDSDMDTTDADFNDSIPQSLFRDQFTQVSEVNYSSEEHLNLSTSVQKSESNSIDSVIPQPGQTSVTSNSSELHLDSIISDQDSGTMSITSMRDQFTQVTTDHNSSEDQLISTRSDQNSESGSSISMRDQAVEVTTDHNSSEENIHSDESTSSIGGNEQHRDTLFHN